MFDDRGAAQQSLVRLQAIFSKRGDCRSLADGGVHVGGGVAVEKYQIRASRPGAVELARLAPNRSGRVCWPSILRLLLELEAALLVGWALRVDWSACSETGADGGEEAE